jgi:hypothetical protein
MTFNVPNKLTQVSETHLESYAPIGSWGKSAQNKKHSDETHVPNPLPRLTNTFLQRYPEALGTTPPSLRGSVLPQYKRCGKPNCACAGADGEKHGPYWYLFITKDGKTSKRYIRMDELETVRALVAGGKKRWRSHRATRRELRDIRANFAEIAHQFDTDAARSLVEPSPGRPGVLRAQLDWILEQAIERRVLPK